MANFGSNYVLVILVLLLNVISTRALSCYNRYKFLSYEYCYGSQNDCCGYYSYQYCCYTSVTAGTIVGIVIGCLIGIAILVGLLICCCVAMNKNRGTTGRVVRPVGGVTVVNTATHQPGYGGAPAPGYASYGMYGHPQPQPGPASTPAYSYPPPGAAPGPDPVYPPPPAYQPPTDGQKT